MVTETPDCNGHAAQARRGTPRYPPRHGLRPTDLELLVGCEVVQRLGHLQPQFGHNKAHPNLDTISPNLANLDTLKYPERTPSKHEATKLQTTGSDTKTKKTNTPRTGKRKTMR